MGAHFPISQVAAALEVGCTHGVRWEDLRSWSGWMDEGIPQTLIYHRSIQRMENIYVHIHIFFLRVHVSIQLHLWVNDDLTEPDDIFVGRFFPWSSKLTYYSIHLQISAIMVNWWFGSRWFGFLGYPYERDCYLGVPRFESQSHQAKPPICH